PRRVEVIEPTVVTVAPWDGAAPGDEVAVFGHDALYSATDLAELVDTIGEEIALRVSPAIERVYTSTRA
uniref:alanine racemase C-terminal domain-containing protein n=1 Tax=uncultured Microbacterium sp. TaxID=191216 RepID=UPI0025E97520